MKTFCVVERIFFKGRVVENSLFFLRFICRTFFLMKRFGCVAWWIWIKRKNVLFGLFYGTKRLFCQCLIFLCWRLIKKSYLCNAKDNNIYDKRCLVNAKNDTLFYVIMVKSVVFCVGLVLRRSVVRCSQNRLLTQRLDGRPSRVE